MKVLSRRSLPIAAGWNKELKALGENFHRRLSAGQDLWVSEELCEVFLPPLASALQRRFYQVKDPHLAASFAIDALLRYMDSPAAFAPERSSLIAYLYMDACGDLMNFLEKQKKFVELHTSLSEYEVRGAVVAQTPESLLLEQSVALAEAEFMQMAEPTDRLLIELILNRVRETESYVTVLEIEALDRQAQINMVKKHKDRLKIRLKRWLRKTGYKTVK
ncbi:MAG: hypothetical protein HY231_22705 [Acidobacteria bacterium]|nr:hypothetical protein [Acidobacteriota bacterium]